MRSRWHWLLILSAGLLCAACGATIGAPCTVNADCPNNECINAPYAPGGYCSKACTVGQDSTTCPAGSTCVTDGIRTGVPGCFRICKADSDCRAGYSCMGNQNGNPHPICVASPGV